MNNKSFYIWMNARGEICYQFNLSSHVHNSSPHKAGLAISNYCKAEIKITNKEPKRIDNYINYIYTNSLPLVEDDVFCPLTRDKFFVKQNNPDLTYRNKYTYLGSPRPFYKGQVIDTYTLSYIFYLADCNISKFHFIMKWIADFFNDFNNRTNKKLVLIGGKDSGIDILFNNVITPLFGNEYCVSIDDEKLNNTYLVNLIKEKLFFNLDNISITSFQQKDTGMFLKEIIQNTGIIKIRHRQCLEEINNYAQMLITANNNNLPYIDVNDDDYVVFNVNKILEKDLILKQDGPNGPSFLRETRENIINRIRIDIPNFATLLNVYNSIDTTEFIDDRNCLVLSRDRKLHYFVDAIMNKNIAFFEKIRLQDVHLYDSIIEGFESNKFYQSNLIKCFNAIYQDEIFESARTLMVELRKINSIFKTESIKSGSGGIKYFSL